MDEFARFIGYTVMAGCALVIMCWFVWLVMEFSLKVLRDSWNASDVMEATKEWRANHPEKFAKWKKRNGIDDRD